MKKKSEKVEELFEFLNSKAEEEAEENNSSACKQQETLKEIDIVKTISENNNDSDAPANSESASVGGQDFVELSNASIKPAKNLWSLFLKRFFDVILSGLGIIILSPVMLIVAVLVRIKLGGPVIFSQYRPGKRNKIFKLYKFRSMTNKCDENGNLLPDSERMTKFGNALRKTSLDELPQLFNIFKGDMSIIGPRPKLIKDMVFYNDDQNVRSLVRPGLTGLAQVNGRNNATWEEIFEYDRTYVQKIGFITDLKIFFKTIGKVLKRSDIVEQNAVSQNYYFGDYLLESNQISQEEYNAKVSAANEILSAASKR